MKRLPTLALTVMLALPAASTEIHHGHSITLTDDEADACTLGGGCLLMTREQLGEAIRKAGKRFAGDCMGST